ncbi:HNH endonuclease family protein [Corynebacterium alimapuense]|uniref:HNH endonuclease n=1 Tax=Corynebacterium alimapuense TaxID=1576874 RepID=A0A3M8K7H0_9CORY|nr:HNH endonuclease family protein [Corynebacterium alimapuense]RNE48428.1 HNH endonuclease [Corynebacterium alimapuense]
MRPLFWYLILLTVATLALLLPHLLPRSGPGLPALDAALIQVPVSPQRARVLGYERSEFGPGWAHSGACSIREEMIVTHLQHAQLEDCRAVGGMLHDPYTGHQVILPAPVEIDHIFPLAAAWDLGAHTWSDSQRVAFANDPANLVVTAQAANREKSDLLPAEWLPPDRSARCWYSHRLAVVAGSYGLALPDEDISAMRGSCRGLLEWTSLDTTG